MSCFSHYYMHSCSFCHNYSYLLALLTSQSACLLDSMSDLMLNSMQSSMLNLTLDSTSNLTLNFTSDSSQKSHMLNQIMSNHCALTSMTDLVHSHIYIIM